MPIIPPTDENLHVCALALQGGSLVAIPTETVYGLAANALDAGAIHKIFALKGRPATNPLIVHVADIAGARLVCEWNERAQQLAEQFWPGPLTLVLPKRDGIPNTVSAQLPTVGVRAPDHPVALKLLSLAALPLAAPSANLSNALSPTSPLHVQKALGDSLLILDGGACEVGIESTVLDLSGATPTILRPGKISAHEIENLIGPLQTPDFLMSAGAAPAPGMSRKHYAPRAQVHLFPTLTDAIFHAHALGWNKKIGILAFTPTQIEAFEILMPREAAPYGARLFSALHELEAAGCELILIEEVPASRDFDALRDRLYRAAG